jgi:hypothetical protein
VLVRVSPNVDPHARKRRRAIDSSSASQSTAYARRAVVQALSSANLGSGAAALARRSSSWSRTLANDIDDVVRARDARQHGLELREYNCGSSRGAVRVPQAARAGRVPRRSSIRCARRSARGLDGRATVEPRSIVARAGVALYTAARAKAPGILPYVSVDGGMADNIRKRCTTRASEQ